mmetsp:Transcript_6744/g.9156  ORF Transcript_6744/g.9156 Transcript_6744/m.9156 type:complete len:205 (+) Transcript_6744:11-625(+)
MGVCFSCFGKEEDGPKPSTLSTEKVSQSKNTNSVLFFPDNKMPCTSLIGSGECKKGVKCKLAHEPTSLVHFLRYIQGAKKSLDICVFTITCDEIANEVILAHKRGVRVRVITDDGQRGNRGSDIERMKADGIAVRDDGNPHNYMHHKFAVIDKTTLLNGSFNWSRHAVLGNYENVVICIDPTLCMRFQGEFDRLWAEFRTTSYV